MTFTTHFELHSQTTRLVEDNLEARRSSSQARDSHPLCCPVQRNLGRHRQPNLSLQITTQAPEVPDFNFELLPLHSQLLRQSRLVSFPPLIDLLKFSGYPYLI